MGNLRWLLLAIFLLVFFGCGHRSTDKITTQSLEGNYQTQNKRALTEINSWCLTGRSAAKYYDSGWQAGIHWCFKDNKASLELSGPVNIGSVFIRYYRGELWIRESKDHLSISHSPERLLEYRLGFSVPLQALRYWFMGLAQPGVESSQQLDEQGRLVVLQQDDWKLRYSNHKAVDGYQLPWKIKLTNQLISLKIVVDEWLLGNEHNTVE